MVYCFCYRPYTGIEVYSGTYFNNFVDLTNYKFLKFVGKGTYRSITMSLTIKNLSLEDVATTQGSVSASAEKTFFIDISALNGLYQIYLNGGVRSGVGDTASYYEIYLSNI